MSPSLRRDSLPLLIGLAVVGSSCSDLVQRERDAQSGDGGAVDAVSPARPAELVATCDDATDGTPCGSPAEERHCLFDACVENACGDGFRAGEEECDDGDENDGDGCSARCQSERCGNGRVDFGEECDDGNTKSGDGCDGSCQLKPFSPGFDGSAMDGSVADGAADAASAECTAALRLVVTPTDHPYNEGDPLTWEWVGLTHRLSLVGELPAIADAGVDAGDGALDDRGLGEAADAAPDGAVPEAPVELPEGWVLAWSATDGSISGDGAVIEYTCDSPTTQGHEVSVLVTRPEPRCPGVRLTTLVGCADPPSAEVCDSGRDEDLDGETDCADLDCADANVCGDTEDLVSCSDNFDNDGDGSFDCEDADCANASECAGGPSEICDDGDDDDGDGDIDCEDADCGEDPACVVVSATCDACVRENCNDYQGSGIDLADACFDGVAPGTGNSTAQPAFGQLCVDAYRCSVRSLDGCAQDTTGPARCACGSATLSECQNSGPAADAQCAEQWNAAAECDPGDWQCTLGTYTNLALPAGFVNFTIECTNSNCQAECFGSDS